ncbi:hypothetical protein [Methylobacterium nodulans]|nr:hypothetical protein [Methylobacterium nodulans]
MATLNLRERQKALADAGGLGADGLDEINLPHRLPCSRSALAVVSA